MIEMEADIAVVGSGFGGSLAALVLNRIGLRCVLVDRSSHPRFAIGESSTPNADLILLDLARRYDLPRIAPLTKYGSWKRTYPEVVRGLKRGFSYFHHRAGQWFQADSRHSTELLVTASPDDERSDTHWLRSDVDGFFASEARAAGIPLFEQTSVNLSKADRGWRLAGTRHDEPVEIVADFVIDATGEYGLIPRTLGILSRADTLSTNSRTVFAHFADMEPWHNVLTAAGGTAADHPFFCDHAALHQVLDDGWMYQLGFDNGVVSAGFVLDVVDCPLDEKLSVQQEWDALLSRYPSIGRQFARAKIVAPQGGLRRTGRLQRRLARMSGDNWVLLPHTAGFIDPLHSTGIAQTLAGIERLAAILAGHWRQPTLPEALRGYEAVLNQELELIDKLVSGCYLARRNFRVFTAFAMLYFAAATTSEHLRASGQIESGTPFLRADNPHFRQLVDRAWRQVGVLGKQQSISPADVDDFERLITQGIQPMNIAGLCDPAVNNMYRHTAIAKPG
jgi:FADH2 O2-dependent halogenase